MKSGPDRPPTPLRRGVGGRLRTHWRGLLGVLLLGVGAPISLAGGWASTNDRLWWLLAAAMCAASAGVLQLDFTRSELDRASALRTGSDVATDNNVRIWNIPPPVRTFTGRDSQLAAIRHELRSTSSPPSALRP